MPRVLPIPAAPMAQLVEKLGRSTSPTSSATCLLRCGRVSKPILTLPQEAGCRLTRFFSAWTPWVGVSPCEVRVW